jgi:predicted signal transduction protein with EAL and GGDEF domain/HAMP domain-containing protein
MQLIFSPAIALLNRMSYTRKFTLLWLMSLVAVAIVVYSLFVSLDRVIQPSQRELEGLVLIDPVSRAVQVIQQHRGISVALLGGNEAMKDRLAAKEMSVASAFRAMEEALPAGLTSGEDFRLLKAGWERLRKEGTHWTVDENFAAHTRMIEQLQSLKSSIADDYALTLDGELATLYLIDSNVNRLPHVLEHLGQLRAYGTGILAGKQIDGRQAIKLNSLIAELDSSLDELETSIRKTVRHNPAVRDSLLEAYGGIADSARTLAGLVKADILTGRFATAPEVFLDMATAEIDRGYAQMYESLLPTTRTLIERRIAKAKNALLTSVAGALLIFLLVVYISVSIYYAIIGSIQSLVHSAQTFAAGDLDVRVKLDTRDEISHIGDSFNKMADGFNALLDERKRAEQEIKGLSAHLQHILASTPALHYACRIDGERLVPTYASPNIKDLWGYDLEEYLGEDGWWWSGMHPEERDGIAGAFRAAVMAGRDSRYAHEYRFQRKDGAYRWVHDELQIIRDPAGRPLEIVGSWMDITQRKRVELELEESKERFYTIIETALDAVVQMDTEGTITGWNARAEKIFGWPREEAIGRAMDETIIPPQYREAHTQGLKHFLAAGEGVILNSQVELLALHRDGHEFPVELSVVPIRTANQYEFSAFIHDITNRKKFESLVWKQANFDELTGLPNRHMFYDRLAQETRKADRTGLSMALLYIDLDHFKEINDTLGHSMGDVLLVDAARRISACVRESDTVARLGGDEFIIVLTELNEIGRIDALTQDILHELAKPFRLGSEVAYITASIGITLYPHDAAGLEELVKNADQAMYAAKNAGRNRFSYFTQAMQQTAQAKLKLTNDLRGALAGHQFEVHYQPIVELATGRIHKAEALIRWQHPERGFVSPAEFIPLAEESGLIVEIGDWVFREAASQAKRWRTLYDAEFQISVNMSPVQFRSASNPCQAWSACLQALDLPGQSMVIEITEGLLLEAEQGVMDKLLRFHETGIQISLDDFGTGYSSLSYLQKFDIDYLKIDQSFTRNLTPGSSNMVLSEAIIMMAHRLDMAVVAEGVETEAQRELLANAGCNHGQGFLFSRPVAAEEFEMLLKTNQAATSLV